MSPRQRFSVLAGLVALVALAAAQPAGVSAQGTPEPIFADGFETGDTSRWSNGQPAEPVLRFAAPAVSFGEGVGTVAVTVQLSTTAATEVSASWTAAPGTATAGVDYLAVGGTVTILAGETTGTIEIEILDDSVDELDETLTLTLSAPVNATLGTPATTTVTITDDDAAPTVALAATTAAVVESAGTVAIGVSLSAASSFAVSIN